MTEVNVATTTVSVLVTGDSVPTVITIAGAGPQGPPGGGLPEGGVEYDLLEKASADDQDGRWTNSPRVAKVAFQTSSPPSLDAAGELAWDYLDQALSYRTDGITVDIAQENLVYVRNQPGNATIPKGAAVAVLGAAANRLTVQLCDASVGGEGCRTLGVAITAIPSPGFGFVSTFGLLRGFNTGAIIGGGVTDGSELFISSTPGVLSTQPQASPGRRVTVGYVVTTGTQGSIFVTVRRGLVVNELDDVLATNPTNGQVLRYVAANNRYQLDTLDAADVGADPAGSAAAVQSNLTSHTGATTSVHGIANTADLVVTTDARLSDARTPTAHKTTHAIGGTDALTPADIGAYAASNPSNFVDAAGAAAAAPVQSVQGLTGAVTFAATISDQGTYFFLQPGS